ncbi:MAG: hypothetical protein M9894_16015 [Planctomycetes bacterium]|nr:hypothetical protein [Planctomycetota bacterium]
MPLGRREALLTAIPGAVARTTDDRALRATLLRRAAEAVIDLAGADRVSVEEVGARLLASVAGDVESPDAAPQAVLALHRFLVRVLASGVPAPASTFAALKPLVHPSVDETAILTWLTQQLANALVRAEFA